MTQPDLLPAPERLYLMVAAYVTGQNLIADGNQVVPKNFQLSKADPR